MDLKDQNQSSMGVEKEKKILVILMATIQILVMQAVMIRVVLT